MGTNRSRPDGEHNSRANVRLNRMRYRYSADIEAIQFTGDNHDEIKQFVCEHAAVEHVSYRQLGRENPAEFDAPNGFRLVISPTNWVIGVDETVSAVSDDWFSRHCTRLV